MGVRGLKKFVHANFNLPIVIPEQQLESEAMILHVDGDGFIFHVLDQQDVYGKDVRTQFGGDYNVLLCLLKRELKRYLVDMKIREIIFYFDGPASAFKDMKKQDRRIQRAEEYEALYQHFEEHTALPKSTDLPLPVLAKEALLEYLLRADTDKGRMRVVLSPDESDLDISRNVRRANATNSSLRHYALANDSDFLLMRECPYIELGSIQAHQGQQQGKKKKAARKTVTARVFERTKVAELVGLSELNLLELGILLGNDFLGGFQRSDFVVKGRDSCEAIPSALLRGWSVAAIQGLVDVLSMAGSGNSSVLVASRHEGDFDDNDENNTEYQENVLAYCRHFYEGNDEELARLDAWASKNPHPKLRSSPSSSSMVTFNCGDEAEEWIRSEEMMTLVKVCTHILTLSLICP